MGQGLGHSVTIGETAANIHKKIVAMQKTAAKKWKVQSVVSKNADGTCKCLCVSYFDARLVADQLTEAFGFLGWQREHFRLDGKEYCRIKVKNPETGDWIVFEDTGTKSKTAGDKGESSDAFKRAAVNIGIGRDNYETDPFWVAGAWGKSGSKEWSKPVDGNGKQIWNLTVHIENLLKNKDFGVAPEDVILTPSATPLLEQIEEAGKDFPDLLANCEKHAKENGAKTLADADDKQLAIYLVRLQQEKRKEAVKTDETLITPVK